MEVRKMGNKNKGKYGVKNRPLTQYQNARNGKKSRFSNGAKLIIALALLAVIAVAFSFTFMSQPAQSSTSPSAQAYPQSIAPVFYSNPKITSNGTKATISSDFVYSNKLVFVDLKLAQKTDTLEFQGRTIPLSLYKDGDYLPLVVISTPSGKTVTGLRVCEPCGSFNFHIVQGKYLQCDVCGTQWDIETFTGASGGCTSYPPPTLSASVGDTVDIDLSPLQTTVTA
jgi:hypothetical protein